MPAWAGVRLVRARAGRYDESYVCPASRSSTWRRSASLAPASRRRRSAHETPFARFEREGAFLHTSIHADCCCLVAAKRRRVGWFGLFIATHLAGIPPTQRLLLFRGPERSRWRLHHRRCDGISVRLATEPNLLRPSRRILTSRRDGYSRAAATPRAKSRLYYCTHAQLSAETA